MAVRIGEDGVRAIETCEGQDEGGEAKDGEGGGEGTFGQW